MPASFDREVSREHQVAVVLENPGNVENVEKIARVCCALGAQKIFLILEAGKPFDPRVDSFAANYQQSVKRVQLEVFGSTTSCLSHIANEGYTTFATMPRPPSINLYESNMGVEAPCLALCFGNEHVGLTEDFEANLRVCIPMVGAAESMNVATCVTLVLAEAQRQRSFASTGPSLLDTDIVRGLAPVELAARREAVQEIPSQMPDQYQSSITPERFQKIVTFAQRRQRSLIVVLVDPGKYDAAAVVRSCDALGVSEVHFVFDKIKPFDPAADRHIRQVSQGSIQWVRSRVFCSIKECVFHLTDRGLDSYALLSPWQADASNVFETNLAMTKGVALWVGNRDGLTEHARVAASSGLYIPTQPPHGELFFTGSVAVVLAEIIRQRKVTSSPKTWMPCPEEQKSTVQWCIETYLQRHPNKPK